MKTAAYWIKKLRLKKHPEGGYYREVYRSGEWIPASGLPRRYAGRRSCSTSIYFLLGGKDVSKFHRLKSDEVWHFYAGSPLTIHMIRAGGKYSSVKLGSDPAQKQKFQHVVRRGSWFGATVDDLDGFTLAGCTVAPGFDFADFELADRLRLLGLCPRKREIIIQLT